MFLVEGSIIEWFQFIERFELELDSLIEAKAFYQSFMSSGALFQEELSPAAAALHSLFFVSRDQSFLSAWRLLDGNKDAISLPNYERRFRNLPRWGQLELTDDLEGWACRLRCLLASEVFENLKSYRHEVLSHNFFRSKHRDKVLSRKSVAYAGSGYTVTWGEVYSLSEEVTDLLAEVLTLSGLGQNSRKTFGTIDASRRDVDQKLRRKKEKFAALIEAVIM